MKTQTLTDIALKEDRIPSGKPGFDPEKPLQPLTLRPSQARHKTHEGQVQDITREDRSCFRFSLECMLVLGLALGGMYGGGAMYVIGSGHHERILDSAARRAAMTAYRPVGGNGMGWGLSESRREMYHEMNRIYCQTRGCYKRSQDHTAMDDHVLPFPELLTLRRIGR